MNLALPALLLWHAAADTILQGRYVSFGKDRHHPLAPPWWLLLAWHAFLHGLGVALITGIPLLGLSEFGLHALIDFGKCEKWWDAWEDQGFHVACKLVWSLAMLS